MAEPHPEPDDDDDQAGDEEAEDDQLPHPGRSLGPGFEPVEVGQRVVRVCGRPADDDVPPAGAEESTDVVAEHDDEGDDDEGDDDEGVERHENTLPCLRNVGEMNE